MTRTVRGADWYLAGCDIPAAVLVRSVWLGSPSHPTSRLPLVLLILGRWVECSAEYRLQSTYRGAQQRTHHLPPGARPVRTHGGWRSVKIYTKIYKRFFRVKPNQPSDNITVNWISRTSQNSEKLAEYNLLSSLRRIPGCLGHSFSTAFITFWLFIDL